MSGLSYGILPNPMKRNTPPLDPATIPSLPSNPYKNFLDVPRVEEEDISYYLRKYKSPLLISVAALVAFIIYKKINR